MTAYQAHSHQIQDCSSQVLSLQETGCTHRAQKRFSAQVAAQGLTVIWGVPSPMIRSASGHWRVDKGQIPGVAMQCPSQVNAVLSPPKTPAGKRLWSSGRLVFVTAILGSFVGHLSDQCTFLRALASRTRMIATPAFRTF